MDEKPEQVTSDQDTSESKSEKKKPNAGMLWIRDIVVCLILVLLFRAGVAEANYIPSPSMEPTLHERDRIIVEKLSMNWRALERGDLVVFHPPLEGREGERWIKRIVGLPGETIEVIRGKVYINGIQLDEPYVERPPSYNDGPLSLNADDPSTPQNEAEYYMMGDNRRNSRDSHVWGPCPEDNIIGRAIFRYWPIMKVGGLGDPENEPHLQE